MKNLHLVFIVLLFFSCEISNTSEEIADQNLVEKHEEEIDLEDGKTNKSYSLLMSFNDKWESRNLKVKENIIEENLWKEKFWVHLNNTQKVDTVNLFVCEKIYSVVLIDSYNKEYIINEYVFKQKEDAEKMLDIFGEGVDFNYHFHKAPQDFWVYEDRMFYIWTGAESRRGDLNEISDFMQQSIK
ncbi:hypothetical protein RCC89_19355 [Cytophagaceae bacterium ABcell3]|nr:hypothetical protein RCC89_19355 [Cytophagaceae bacterium ABcell3]